MSAPKFTPGEWRIKHAAKRRNAFLTCKVIDAEYQSVCSFFGPREQAVANAQLCAAAPELYAALRSLIERLDASDLRALKRAPDGEAATCALIAQARSALGKAVSK